MTALLSTTYFGPIQWYQKLYRADHVLIEQFESFQKQTYRNRCVIATANGTQTLTVPIEHSPLTIEHEPLTIDHSPLISDHGNWRHLHWNALVSAYGESPFFEYYQDDLRPFFTERRWTYLLDFNEAIRQTICELLDITPAVTYTDVFTPPSADSSLSTLHSSPASADSSLFTLHSSPVSADSSLFTLHSSLIKDFRDAINPKHPAPDPDFMPRPYYQVYGQRHGFLPNLSILDLLFNMGPEAIFWL